MREVVGSSPASPTLSVILNQPVYPEHDYHPPPARPPIDLFNPVDNRESLRLKPICLPEQAIGSWVEEEPVLKKLLLELVSDPVTLHHQIMVAEVYLAMANDLITQFSTCCPAKTLRRIKNLLLNIIPMGVLLHDIGKWGTHITAKSSIAATNSTPQNINASPPVDHRPSHQIINHKLHPLIGGLFILKLSEDMPAIPKFVIETWANTCFQHHELPRSFSGWSNPKRYSYPRSSLRFSDKWIKLGDVLVKMADCIVAMGQPRAYRSYRLPYHQIIGALETTLNDDIIQYVLAITNKAQLLSCRHRLISSAGEALGAVQNAYPRDTCLQPQQLGFQLQGTSIPPTPKCRIIDGTNALVWTEHHQRIMSTIKLLQKEMSS